MEKLDIVDTAGDDGHLKKLSFIGQGLKLNTFEDASKVVEELNKSLNEVSVFEMSGNTLGIASCEAIGRALENQEHLKYAMWSDIFTGRLKTEIAPALEHLSQGIISANAHLVEIDLSDNAFGPNGIVGVTKLLASPSCYSLKTLRLNNNGLGHQGCRHLVEALKTGYAASIAAGHPLRLKFFSAGRNRLENVGAVLLAEVFSDMGSLEVLALSQNGIGIHGEEGVKALTKALQKNESLKELNLADNSLTPVGGRQVAKLLKQLPHLEILNLSDCLLRSAGANALAVALEQSECVPHIRELRLSGNEIRTHAAVALASSLADKEELTLFDLNCNELGENGIEAVRATMSSISKDDLLGNFSEDEGDEEEEEDEDNDEDDEGQSDAEEEDEDSELDQENNEENNAIPEVPANPFGKGITFDFREASQSKKPSSIFSNISNLGSSQLWPSVTSDLIPVDSQVEQVLVSFLSVPSEETLCKLIDSSKQTSPQSGVKLPKVEEFMKQDPETTVRAAFTAAVIASDDCKCSEWNWAVHVLTQSLVLAPSRASNAVLVEVGSLKSEDKKFKPACSANPARGLQLVKSSLSHLTAGSIPVEVGSALTTVMRTRLPCHVEESSLIDEIEEQVRRLKLDFAKGDETLSSAVV